MSNVFITMLILSTNNYQKNFCQQLKARVQQSWLALWDTLHKLLQQQHTPETPLLTQHIHTVYKKIKKWFNGLCLCVRHWKTSLLNSLLKLLTLTIKTASRF